MLNLSNEQIKNIENEIVETGGLNYTVGNTFISMFYKIGKIANLGENEVIVKSKNKIPFQGNGVLIEGSIRGLQAQIIQEGRFWIYKLNGETLGKVIHQ